MRLQTTRVKTWEKFRDARITGEEVSDETPEGQEVAELNSDQTDGMERHVEATGDGQGVQVAESSSEEVPGRENPVEAPDCEQMTKPSCAESCAGEPGSDRPDEAPDDAGQDMGTTRNARIAGEEVSDETPEGQEVAEPNSDQTAGMDRHVEATGDGQGVQAAESSGKEVPGRENPVKAQDLGARDKIQLCRRSA